MCTLFLQNLRDMVYARRIKIAQLGPEDEVEGVIEGPFEWIYFEMPIVEVGWNALDATYLPCLLYDCHVGISYTQISPSGITSSPCIAACVDRVNPSLKCSLPKHPAPVRSILRVTVPLPRTWLHHSVCEQSTTHTSALSLSLYPSQCYSFRPMLCRRTLLAPSLPSR